MTKKSLQGRYSPTIHRRKLRKEYCYLYNRKVFLQVGFSFQKKVVKGSMGRVDRYLKIYENSYNLYIYKLC